MSSLQSGASCLDSAASPMPTRSPSPILDGGISPTRVQEPPMEIMLLLIDVFYECCPCSGFFLERERFRQSFLQNLPLGHYSRPTPALLNAIYLWGSHLAPSQLEGFDEKGFLRNCLFYLPKDLSGSHPQRIVHSIQAEVLLSYYYLKHGKVLGGTYHANAAVSLSLSAGLHRIGATEELRTSQSPTNLPIPLTSLSSPAYSREEGERIAAFWAVLILNNSWTAIQESHSMFYDLQNAGVDTPWPMEVIDYQLQLLPRSRSGTIKRFLESASIEGFSAMALHAQAAVLHEQAATIVSTSKPDSNEQREPSDAFTRLDGLIDQFKETSFRSTTPTRKPSLWRES